jgi:hypothetical protein
MCAIFTAVKTNLSFEGGFEPVNNPSKNSSAYVFGCVLIALVIKLFDVLYRKEIYYSNEYFLSG